MAASQPRTVCALFSLSPASSRFVLSSIVGEGVPYGSLPPPSLLVWPSFAAQLMLGVGTSDLDAQRSPPAIFTRHRPKHPYSPCRGDTHRPLQPLLLLLLNRGMQREAGRRGAGVSFPCAVVASGAPGFEQCICPYHFYVGWWDCPVFSCGECWN